MDDPKTRLRAAFAVDPARFALAAIVAALVVALVAAAAGVARILPTLLDPGVPARAARPFFFGLAALSLEVGALVGWPLGWTEAAIRSRERGEARARMALGEAPAKRLARLWPAMLILSLATSVGSFVWGRDAQGPGRVARALLEEGRKTCEASHDGPRTVVVPLVHATWLCRPGRVPLLAGEGAGGAAAMDFAATSLFISDDLTAFTAKNAQILVPGNTPIRLVVGEVRVTGLHPFSTPSSVSPAARAIAIVLAALGSALVATASALRGEVAARASAWAVALAGPAATLAVLRACEQAGTHGLRLVVVPFAALVATLFARLLARTIGDLFRRRDHRRLGASRRPR